MARYNWQKQKKLYKYFNTVPFLFTSDLKLLFLAGGRPAKPVIYI